MAPNVGLGYGEITEIWCKPRDTSEVVSESVEDCAVERLIHVRGGNRGVVARLLQDVESVIYDKSGLQVAADITAKLSSNASLVKERLGCLQN